MFNTKLNSNKLLVNYQNKFYTTNVNLLSASDHFKSELVPLVHKGNGIIPESNEDTIMESLMEVLGSSK
jgi:hypothetical protein